MFAAYDHERSKFVDLNFTQRAFVTVFYTHYQWFIRRH